MNHSKPIAINHLFLDGLLNLFAKIDSELPVILKGNGQFFSCGLDLFTVHKMKENELLKIINKFQSLLLSILTHPSTILGYLNGHAVAGGFILACSCDHAFVKNSKYLFGMNEQKMGITLPPLPNAILNWTFKNNVNKILGKTDFYSTKSITQFDYFSILTENEIPLCNISRNQNRMKFINDYIKQYADKDMENMLKSWFSEQAIKGRENILRQIKK